MLIKKDSNLLFFGGVAIFLGAWLIYDKGLLIGLQQLSSYAYLVALFYLSARITTALFSRQPLHKLEYISIAVVVAFFGIAIFYSWPGIAFLTLMILVCGTVLGVALRIIWPARSQE